MKYLDPKADLTFKKIFGKHPDLLISLLNALLPLGEDQRIVSVEYLPNELVPELSEHKHSIVDVMCRDVEGRFFCVEMQMEWSKAFKQRVLFNASKIYVTQAVHSQKYRDLRPVYSLNLVNDVFEPKVPEFIHNYNIVHDTYSDKVIEGLHFTFIELPKFTPHSISEKKMMVLWLRFLTEIGEGTLQVSEDMLENPEISKALEELKVSSFTDEELRAYDKFRDIVWTERTLQDDSYQNGLVEGEAKGMAKGRAEGEKAKALQIAKKMLGKGLDIETIMDMTSLSREEILQLKG